MRGKKAGVGKLNKEQGTRNDEVRRKFYSM